ncbi:uncharacterized protein LOC141592575 isoform X3 [Silene latifolia]|uniref:uncharacterized protein LOC141592575 isoform X3 n=2 Tax=Silene latifolia TaxID=37657 RepID=UPI003D789C93
MPGTIQVSILELVDLPSLQQSSSMGIKVSMGKQSYNIQEKGDSSFALASLRDNLSVTIHDSEGNEIAHTGVESRSIVEKGTWDDIFPFQGGGHVRMRLHFILTEEEQKRIRSMRESAARKKQEDHLKRSRSSSDLAVSSGDLLKTSQRIQDGNMNPAGRQPKFPSSSNAIVPFRGDLLKISQQVQDGKMNPAGGQPKFPPSSSAIVPFQVRRGQNKQLLLKQAFSTSKSTGALDKLPGYQRVKKEIQDQDGEQRNQLDKTPMKVRNMIRAFESSPVKEAPPATSKTRETTQLSSITTTDIPLKAPKKTVPMSAKPVLSKLGAKPAPISEKKAIENEEVTTDIHLRSPRKVSTSAKPVLPNIEFMSAPASKQMVKEKGEIGDFVNSFQEICSTTSRDTPLKVPKKMIPMTLTQKPLMSDFDTLPAPISEEIVADRVEVGHSVDLCQEIVVQKTEQSKELRSQTIEHMSNEKNVPQEVPVKEEIVKEKISPNKLHGEQSTYSWKTISQGLPRHFTDKLFMKNQISTSFDSSVLEKTWRSKHPKFRGYNVKPKLSCGNKYSSSGSSSGWIFVEEIIHSCVPSNDRPLIALLEGSSSNCSHDTMQEKLRDTDFVPGEDDERSVELRPLGPGERPKSPDNNPHIRPVRQIVNIAIMVGFGLLVLLTRQGK